MLVATLELRKKIVREIRRFKPEVVMTGDPTTSGRGTIISTTPNHRAASTAALDATFPAAGQPNLFEELEQEGAETTHKPRKVFVTTGDTVDVDVNIESTIDIKIAALPRS